MKNKYSKFLLLSLLPPLFLVLQNCGGDDLLEIKKKKALFSAGSFHNCALLDNSTSGEKGSLKCWGHNSSGLLGLGHTKNVGDNMTSMGNYMKETNLGTGALIKDFSLGWMHSCVIFDNGSEKGKVKCWGNNNYGQLGILAIGTTRGDGPNEMGDNLPSVNLGGAEVTSISLGGYHSCALFDNSTSEVDKKQLIKVPPGTTVIDNQGNEIFCQYRI